MVSKVSVSPFSSAITISIHSAFVKMRRYKLMDSNCCSNRLRKFSSDNFNIFCSSASHCFTAGGNVILDLRYRFTRSKICLQIFHLARDSRPSRYAAHEAEVLHRTCNTLFFHSSPKNAHSSRRGFSNLETPV